MKVVFTCVTNRYDHLSPILFKNPDWRYVAFVDDLSMEANGWELISISRLSPPELPENKLQRWVKITGAIEYLKCDSIYVDGSSLLKADITDLWTGEMRLKRHPVRDCYIDEAQACIRLNKAHKESVISQVSRYESEGLKRRSGMYETHVLIRPYTGFVSNFCEVWWEEVRKETHWDQLSIIYALSKIRPHFEVIEPNEINKYIFINKHAGNILHTVVRP